VDEQLRRLLLGELRVGELPPRLDLAPVWSGLAELCRRSLGMEPGDSARLLQRSNGQVEWGGCVLVDGTVVLMSHQVPGGPDHVDPHPDCTPTGHAPLVYGGFAHVHLPHSQFGGVYPGFSQWDYRASMADGDNLAVACNGVEVFALARTIDATQPRGEPSGEVFASWLEVYRQVNQKARAAMAADLAGGQPARDLLEGELYQANRQLCLELGLAFYAGRWGQPLVLVFRPLPRSQPS
jgi:hypothetical protein